MSLDEPNFSGERELEDAIGAAARHFLERADANAVVMRGFGLDLAVFSTRAGLFQGLRGKRLSPSRGFSL
jgi:hypothetical protein